MITECKVYTRTSAHTHTRKKKKQQYFLDKFVPMFYFKRRREGRVTKRVLKVQECKSIRV